MIPIYCIGGLVILLTLLAMIYAVGLMDMIDDEPPDVKGIQ